MQHFHRKMKSNIVNNFTERQLGERRVEKGRKKIFIMRFNKRFCAIKYKWKILNV